MVGPCRVAAVSLLGVVLAIAGASAEVVSTARIEVGNSVLFGAEDVGAENEAAAAGSATAELDFAARGNRDVRSRLQLRAHLAETTDGNAVSTVTVPRAEIRWRMTTDGGYTMRYTVGRTRLTWGDGELFNAGDVINGARPAAVDLTADTLRDETLWLAAAYFPLGRFAFVEPVVLLPMVRTDPVSGDRTIPAAADTAAGARVQGQVGSVKTELGYLFRGDGGLHQPYLSLQGNLFLDWYGALRWEHETPAAPADGRWTASGGLLYTGSHRRLGSITVRLEGLWRTAEHMISVYPAVTWSPSELFTILLRGQARVVDDGIRTEIETLPADAAAGISWTPTTALTLSLFTTVRSPTDSATMSALVGYAF